MGIKEADWTIFNPNGQYYNLFAYNQTNLCALKLEKTFDSPKSPKPLQNQCPNLQTAKPSQKQPTHLNDTPIDLKTCHMIPYLPNTIKEKIITIKGFKDNIYVFTTDNIYKILFNQVMLPISRAPSSVSIKQVNMRDPKSLYFLGDDNHLYLAADLSDLRNPTRVTKEALNEPFMLRSNEDFTIVRSADPYVGYVYLLLNHTVPQFRYTEDVLFSNQSYHTAITVGKTIVFSGDMNYMIYKLDTYGRGFVRSQDFGSKDLIGVIFESSFSYAIIKFKLDPATQWIHKETHAINDIGLECSPDTREVQMWDSSHAETFVTLKEDHFGVLLGHRIQWEERLNSAGLFLWIFFGFLVITAVYCIFKQYLGFREDTLLLRALNHEQKKKVETRKLVRESLNKQWTREKYLSIISKFMMEKRISEFKKERKKRSDDTLVASIGLDFTDGTVDSGSLLQRAGVAIVQPGSNPSGQKSSKKSKTGYSTFVDFDISQYKGYDDEKEYTDFIIHDDGFGDGEEEKGRDGVGEGLEKPRKRKYRKNMLFGRKVQKGSLEVPGADLDDIRSGSGGGGGSRASREGSGRRGFLWFGKNLKKSKKSSKQLSRSKKSKVGGSAVFGESRKHSGMSSALFSSGQFPKRAFGDVADFNYSNKKNRNRIASSNDYQEDRREEDSEQPGRDIKSQKYEMREISDSSQKSKKEASEARFNLEAKLNSITVAEGSPVIEEEVKNVKKRELNLEQNSEASESLEDETKGGEADGDGNGLPESSPSPSNSYERRQRHYEKIMKKFNVTVKKTERRRGSKEAGQIGSVSPPGGFTMDSIDERGYS